MYQLKIKRFFAYSTITNIGFILIALNIFNIEGVFASLFYLFCYILTIFIFFIILLNYKKNGNIELFKLFDLSIFNYNINLIFFISFIFFSFIGLPPFMGFFGKFFIYFNMIMSYNYFSLFLLMLFSIIIGFYYLRIIRFFFFRFKIEKKYIINIDINNIFIIFSFFNLFFLFFFDFFSEYIYLVLIYYYISI
jgi:NADH:ubiquinone oxidoreductase subunit 2 (subunit N)